MRNDTKLAKIRDAMRDERWDDALRLATRFQRLGEHDDQIRRAAEAVLRPDFYEQIGRDVDVIRHEGIEALKERFSASWEQVQSERDDT